MAFLENLKERFKKKMAEAAERRKIAKENRDVAKKQIVAANRIIAEKSRAAALRERQRQQVRLAEEKQRLIAERQMATLRRSGGRTGFSALIYNAAKPSPKSKPKKIKKMAAVDKSLFSTHMRADDDFLKIIERI